MNNFIYGQFIDKKLCDKMVEFHKDRKDLYRNDDINTNINGKKVPYKRSTEIALEPIDFFDEFPEYDIELSKVLQSYFKKYPHSTNDQNKFFIEQNIKIQRYKPGEGFYGYHFENDGRGWDLYRHLVFMTYLNNVDDCGTEWLYQKYKVKAKKGYTVIWPAIWTHTHRGIISQTKEKYIATGWYTYSKNSDVTNKKYYK